MTCQKIAHLYLHHRWLLSSQQRLDWPSEKSAERSLAQGVSEIKIFNEAIIDNFKTDKVIIHLILAAVYSDFCELVPLYQSIELLKSKKKYKVFSTRDL